MSEKSRDPSISNEQLATIKEYAQEQMRGERQLKHTIHNWNYTEELIEIARTLIKKDVSATGIKNEVETILCFLNLGYSLDLANPLKAGAQRAGEYLQSMNIDPSIIDTIVEGIASMARYNSIKSLSVAIAQDAATSYFGKKKLKSFILSELEEYNIIMEQTHDKVKWVSRYVHIISSHTYNTKAARKIWIKRKAKNVKKLKKYLYELKMNSSLSYNKRAMTMFKTASRNQIDLVGIADKKAGIMITVNAVLITLMLPLFASYIIDISRFIVPAILMLATSGISIILATLATKPIFRKVPSQKDYLSGNRSLFFFRNFIGLRKDEYKQAVQQVIVSDATFENSVITDLYDLGQTLGIKYRKLTWCYWIFAIGVGLTIISFAICLITFESF